MINYDFIPYVQRPTKKLKPWMEKLNDYAYYTQLILSLLVNRYTWIGLPETVDTRFLELTLALYGHAAITYHNGAFYAVSGSYSGDVNPYNIGTLYVYANAVFQGEKIVNENIVVCHNNKLIHPNVGLLEKYAKMLCEADTSIRVGMINTRPNVGFSASDKQQEKQIEEMYKKTVEGQPFVIKDDQLINDGMRSFSLSGTANNGMVLRECIAAREEILSQMCCDLGIPFKTKDKQAQVVTEELKGFEAYSGMMVDDGLRERDEFCKRLKKVFDLDVSVYINDIIDTSISDPEESGEEVESDENKRIEHESAGSDTGA